MKGFWMWNLNRWKILGCWAREGSRWLPSPSPLATRLTRMTGLTPCWSPGRLNCAEGFYIFRKYRLDWQLPRHRWNLCIRRRISRFDRKASWWQHQNVGFYWPNIIMECPLLFWSTWSFKLYQIYMYLGSSAVEGRPFWLFFFRKLHCIEVHRWAGREKSQGRD